MKNTGVCPKCTSTDIRVMNRKMWGTMIPLNFTVFAAAYTEWFICTSCGFVETWVQTKKDLDKIRQRLAQP